MGASQTKCPACPPSKVCPECPPSKVCPECPPSKVCPECPPMKECQQNIDDMTLLSYRLMVLEGMSRRFIDLGRLTEMEIRQKVDNLRQQYGELGGRTGELSGSRVQERFMRDFIDWVRTPATPGGTSGASVVKSLSNQTVVLSLILILVSTIGLYFYLRQKKK